MNAEKTYRGMVRHDARGEEKGDMALRMEDVPLPAGWQWHGGDARLHSGIPYDQFESWLHEKCQDALIL